MLIGGLVKVVINYLLVGQPAVNITGAPIGTLVCYITITILNLVAMRRMMVRRPRVLSSMVKPLIATVIMAASAYLSYDLLALVLPSQTICCLGAIAIAVIIYGNQRFVATHYYTG